MSGLRKQQTPNTEKHEQNADINDMTDTVSESCDVGYKSGQTSELTTKLRIGSMYPGKCVVFGTGNG